MEHKYTKEEIIKALKVIRDVCDDNGDCVNCPLGNSNGDCMLEATPLEWKILDENPTVWRALL